MRQSQQWNGIVATARAWLVRPELPVLLAVLALVTAGWLFYELADQVLAGGTQKFDERIVQSLRNPANPQLPRGPHWLVVAGFDISALGSVTVLTLMTALVAGYLALRRKYRAMWLMILAVASGALGSMVLKQAIGRPRPHVVSGLILPLSPSFPSAHSMLSAIVYLALGTMLARLESNRLLKIYFLGVAMLLTLLVGLSRIYLGVHYPSDVLGGWTAGLIWALAWWLIARYLQSRGAVERSDARD